MTAEATMRGWISGNRIYGIKEAAMKLGWQVSNGPAAFVNLEDQVRTRGQVGHVRGVAKAKIFYGIKTLKYNMIIKLTDLSRFNFIHKPRNTTWDLERCAW